MGRGGPSSKRKPISDAERADIIKAIEAGGTRNDVAKRFGRALASITKIANEAGLAFDRSQTKSATAAKKADNQSKLAEIQRRLLEEAGVALDELHAETTIYHWTEGKFMQAVVPAPTFKDKRDISWRVGSMIRNYLEIEHRESDEGATDALTVWREALEAEAERRRSE